MIPKMKRRAYIGLLLALSLLSFLGLWYVQTSPPPHMPKHFFTAKIVKVLYHDTLWAALYWPSGKRTRLWQEYHLAEQSDDWAFCCDIDSALQWAWDRGCFEFEQPNENGTVDYFSIVFPEMTFKVITPLKSETYRPRVLGWAHISADTGGYWDLHRNLHLPRISYCVSVEQDSTFLSDSAIYRRLHDLPSPHIY